MDDYVKRLKGDAWEHEGMKFSRLQDLCAHFGADYNRVYYAIARKRNMTLAQAIARNPYERAPQDAESQVLRAIYEEPIVDGNKRECILSIGKIIGKYLRDHPITKESTHVQNQP